MILFGKERRREKKTRTLYRPKDGELQNLDDLETGPTSFEIDCFGQGDAAKISQQAQNSPLALLGYLDKFIDISTASAEEEVAREELLALQWIPANLQQVW